MRREDDIRRTARARTELRRSLGGYRRRCSALRPVRTGCYRAALERRALRALRCLRKGDRAMIGQDIPDNKVASQNGIAHRTGGADQARTARQRRGQVDGKTKLWLHLVPISQGRRIADGDARRAGGREITEDHERLIAPVKLGQRGSGGCRRRSLPSRGGGRAPTQVQARARRQHSARQQNAARQNGPLHRQTQ